MSAVIAYAVREIEALLPLTSGNFRTVGLKEAGRFGSDCAPKGAANMDQDVSVRKVREFLSCGPCRVLGILLRETRENYVLLPAIDKHRYEAKERQVLKCGAHVDPCPFCSDTRYRKD